MCFFLSVIFVLEDDSLIGLRSLVQTPAMLFQLLAVCLVIYLQQVLYMVARVWLPSKARESMLFYKNVEEVIYMEEYEDTNHEFQISNNLAQNQLLSKQIKTRELAAINQNMMRLHRSDSMDQILEKINKYDDQKESKQQKLINRSTLVNKYLKLNDFNKELEY